MKTFPLTFEQIPRILAAHNRLRIEDGTRNLDPHSAQALVLESLKAILASLDNRSAIGKELPKLSQRYAPAS